jgi:acyl-CoA synthetase (AMP-forming)/AMP-acid ligase II
MVVIFIQIFVRLNGDVTTVSSHLFGESIRDLAAALENKYNMKPGEKVIVALPLGIDLFRVIFAINKSGATAVFVNPNNSTGVSF